MSNKINRITISDNRNNIIRDCGVYSSGYLYDINPITTANVVVISPAPVQTFWNSAANTYFQYILNPWTILNRPPGYNPDYLIYEYVLPPDEGTFLVATSFIEVEYNYTNHPAVDITKIFKCFEAIPDAGSVYSMTLNSDVPVNWYPSGMADVTVYDGFSPGHVFITLSKTNGLQTVTKSFGFYPQQNGLRTAFSSVPSKIVNNADHEINASIQMNNLTQSDFNTIKQSALNYSGGEYSLSQNNCTHFALNVFNSIRPGNTITTEPAFFFFPDPNQPPIPANQYSITASPQKLFKKLSEMQFSCSPEAGSIIISTTHNYKSPSTPGECE